MGYSPLTDFIPCVRVRVCDTDCMWCALSRYLPDGEGGGDGDTLPGSPTGPMSPLASRLGQGGSSPTGGLGSSSYGAFSKSVSWLEGEYSRSKGEEEEGEEEGEGTEFGGAGAGAAGQGSTTTAHVLQVGTSVPCIVLP